MIRALPAVVAALHWLAPGLPPTVVRNYATVIQQQAAERSFDPYTLAAIVDNETGRTWNARVMDKSAQQCIGLAQICLSNYPTCRDSNFKSAWCLEQKARLQDGVYNLRTAAALITANRRMCRRRTGKPALFARWLASYQGANRPSRGILCNQKRDARGLWRDRRAPRVTRKVMARRRELVRRFGG